MGAQGSRPRATSSNRVLDEFTLDDENRALTTDSMLRLWKYHQTCPVGSPEREVVRILQVYETKLKDTFETLLNLEEGALLFLVFTEPGRTVEPSLIIQKLPDGTKTEILYPREQNPRIFEHLRAEHPGYNRYLVVRLQTP